MRVEIEGIQYYSIVEIEAYINSQLESSEKDAEFLDYSEDYKKGFACCKKEVLTALQHKDSEGISLKTINDIRTDIQTIITGFEEEKSGYQETVIHDADMVCTGLKMSLDVIKRGIGEKIDD